MCVPHEATWLRGRWGPDSAHALLAKPHSHSGIPFPNLLEGALRAGGGRGSEPLRRGSEKDMPSLTHVGLNRARPAEGACGSPPFSCPAHQHHP